MAGGRGITIPRPPCDALVHKPAVGQVCVCGQRVRWVYGLTTVRVRVGVDGLVAGTVVSKLIGLIAVRVVRSVKLLETVCVIHGVSRLETVCVCDTVNCSLIL